MLKLLSRSLRNLLKPAGMVAIALALLLTFFSAPLFAQTSSQLGSRVARLETENTTLRSRISRLESAISRLGQGGGSSIQIEPPPEAVPSTLQSDDPMFDRLATLVIETKQQVLALEERVAALEAQH
jgi:BMFP domain-containing protein YqiC